MAGDKDMKFNIKAGLDSSALDRQINQIKQKLQSLTQNQGYSDKAKQLFGDTSPMGQAAQRVFQRERQADIRQLTAEYNNMDKVIGKIEKRMDAIKESMKTQTDEVKKQSQVKLDSLTRQQAAMARGQTDIAGTMAGQGMDPQGQPLPRGGVSGMLGRMYRGVGGFGGVMTGVGGALGLAQNLYGQNIRADYAIRQSQGSAMQGLVGREMGKLGTGKFEEDFFFRNQREEAAKRASEFRGQRYREDSLGVAKNMALMAGGAATAGAGLAGALPTGGASLLGTIGGIGTAMYGAGKQFLTPGGLQQFAARSPMFQDTDIAKKYRAGLNQEMAQKFVEDFETRKQMSPFERERFKMVEQNRDSWRRTQRLQQLGDQDFLGQLAGGNQAGFMQGETMQAAGAIAQAGGSSGAMRGLSTLANQAQRGGILDAGSMVGRISRNVGNEGQTEQQFIRMLAEGTKQGLNASELPQETRAFANAVVQFAEANNVQDVGGLAKRMLGAFGPDVGEMTMAQMQGALSGYQQFQEMGTRGGPTRMQMWASALTDDRMKGLESDELSYVFSKSSEELMKDTPATRQLASRMGFSEDQFEDYKKKIGEFKQENTFSDPKTRRMQKELKQLRTRQTSSVLSPEARAENKKRIRELEGGLQMRLGYAEGVSTRAEEEQGIIRSATSDMYGAGASEADIAAQKGRLTQLPDTYAETSRAAQAKTEGVRMRDLMKPEGLDRMKESAREITRMSPEDMSNYVKAQSDMAEAIKSVNSDDAEKAAQALSKIGESLTKLSEIGNAAAQGVDNYVGRRGTQGQGGIIEDILSIPLFKESKPKVEEP